MLAAWWWIDRWRKSSAYNDMTAEEQGLYRNLLDECWLRPGGILPDDAHALERICGDHRAWERSGQKVLRWFRRVEGGWINDTQQEIINQSKRRAENQRRYRQRLDNGADNGTDNGTDNTPDNKPASPISVSVSVSGSVSGTVSDKKPKEGEATLSSQCPVSDQPVTSHRPENGKTPSQEPQNTNREVGGFDAFWKAYPKKVAKESALRWWKKNRPGAEMVTRMLATLKWQSESPDWQKENRKFVPHPATWLNEGRWEDEPPAAEEEEPDPYAGWPLLFTCKHGNSAEVPYGTPKICDCEEQHDEVPI